jgi:hypothetical protein
MGRPPIGKVAMTSTERVHRFRAKQRADKPETKRGAVDTAALKQQLAQAYKRIAELERRGESQLTRSHREERSRPVEFTEVGKLRAELGRLKSAYFKLNAMLQEEPDAAKLRKKVVDQQVKMASMRRNIKQLIKERDEYRSKFERYAMAKHREARRLLTRQNHDLIIKALHSDRLKQCTATELAAAERVAVALRPLFDESLR